MVDTKWCVGRATSLSICKSKTKGLSMLQRKCHSPPSPHPSNSRNGGSASVNFCNFMKLRMCQSCPLYAVIGQVCGGVNVGGVSTLSHPLLSFFTQLHLSLFMWATVFNTMNVFEKRLKVCTACRLNATTCERHIVDQALLNANTVILLFNWHMLSFKG